MKSVGIAAPAPLDISALTVEKGIAMAHRASMVQLALPLPMAMSVCVLLATLEPTAEKASVILHHATTEPPAFLALEAMNVLVIMDSL